MTPRGITLYAAMSVDGYLADVEGGVGWLEPFETAAEGDDGGYSAFFETVDCLVMGSVTYELVLGFGEWPYGDTPTYVFTGRTLPAATEAVQFVDRPVGGFAPELRREYDHVWLVGGAALARSFLRADQVDRLRLSFVPVLLGEGIPLFSGGYDGRELKLIDVTTRDSGIVEHQYEVASEA
ncbi:dihydrofolate reductase family protein [Halolamina litorea]|uniref:Dihydrofolate reductase family protein n=1 Tax=Halolamina litorea TaxID=1515593 RepID=A0ABD6BUC3_9EURY|nr:dihydrofolate reductase family protein [Halolamina litorea]